MRISDWSSAVCSSDLPTYVRFLLEHGANPDIRDNQGTTPLMLAVTQNAPGCVAALLNPPAGRSEARRVGNASGRTCRSRWSPYHYKKNRSLPIPLITHKHPNTTPSY